MAAVEPRERARLQRRLLAWYAEHQRDLPWRRSRDPYAIWVSEAMLQQTQVATVVPFWERFLERFPTPADLAAADDEALLAAWSGLGYYRRARFLREAARAVVERHGGELPAEREALLALPGIGPYTAGALLSIAFGQAEPLVDGNVGRVLARWFGLEGPLESTPVKKRLWELAAEWVPGPRTRSDPGAWNQALMELGATVCRPVRPDCAACPLAGSCWAREHGAVERLPSPPVRRQAIAVELELLWVVRSGALLLHQRPDGGRMSGLYELPTRECPPPGEATRLWPEHFPHEVGPGRNPPSLRTGPELGSLRHGITRHRISARVLTAATRATAVPPYAWLPLEEVRRAGLTGMTRKALERPFARRTLEA